MHLLGFDHEKDADAEIMEDREVQILKTLEPQLS
jgi:probable rRNA maturation factor